MAEGQAFYHEYQYYGAAAALLDKPPLTPRQQAGLYGTKRDEQRTAVLAGQLEPYIWPIIRCFHALCDVRVNAKFSRTPRTPCFEAGDCWGTLVAPAI